MQHDRFYDVRRAVQEQSAAANAACAAARDAHLELARLHLKRSAAHLSVQPARS